LSRSSTTDARAGPGRSRSFRRRNARVTRPCCDLSNMVSCWPLAVRGSLFLEPTAFQ
jgi:hypothetical protein